MADKKLEEIKNKLVDEAKRDGIITDDEYALLKEVEFDLERYDKSVKSAQEKGTVTAEEIKELHKFRAEIIKAAWSIADKDHLINQDEANIMSLVWNLIVELKDE